MDFTKDFAMDITNNSTNNITKHFTNDFNEDLSRAQRVIIGRARARYKPGFQKLMGKTKKNMVLVLTRTFRATKGRASARCEFNFQNSGTTADAH